jgi:putative transposase
VPAVGELLPDELVDELLAGARSEEEIVGPGGLLSQLTKRLVERALAVELTDHLGYERGQAPPGGAGNARNGTASKTLQTEHGPMRIEAPRDRKGSFGARVQARPAAASRRLFAQSGRNPVGREGPWGPLTSAHEQ